MTQILGEINMTGSLVLATACGAWMALITYIAFSAITIAEKADKEMKTLKSDLQLHKINSQTRHEVLRDHIFKLDTQFPECFKQIDETINKQNEYMHVKYDKNNEAMRLYVDKTISEMQKHCARLRAGQIKLDEKLSKKRPLLSMPGPIQVEIYHPQGAFGVVRDRKVAPGVHPSKNLGKKPKGKTA